MVTFIISSAFAHCHQQGENRMFDTRVYKKTALQQLKGRWSVPLIASAILVIMLAAYTWISKNSIDTDLINVSTSGTYFSFHTNVRASSRTGMLIPIIFCAIFGTLFIALLGVNENLYRTYQRQDFSIYTKSLDHWFSSIKTSLWFMLWIGIWICCFVVPAFVKAYSYSMMFFIQAEYPRIKATRAMKISKILTSCHKADLFFMDLSFTGWFMLGCLTGGVGLAWLLPYYTMTKTNAYHELKNMALAARLVTLQDFES